MLKFHGSGRLTALLAIVLTCQTGCAPSNSSSSPKHSEPVNEAPAVPAAPTPDTDTDTVAEPARLPPPEGATPMAKPDRVWIDAKKSAVYVDGYVSLRKGMLEMLACPVGTKEHESVVAVHARAQVVHAALLAVGAKIGSPVKWAPDFVPPSGTEITVEVRWLDESGKWQSKVAQRWVKDIQTNQPMKHPWVFAGSGFWKDEESGKEYYMADAGDFICVSNFETATLDITAESSQVTDGLMFEANTEEIPPLGTPVRLVLTPKVAVVEGANSP